jgi:hypothetical protein
MQDFVTDKNLQAQANIVRQIKLINVSEIQILKEVLFVIGTKYFAEKKHIEPAAVCALLLNHPAIPPFYATSTKGYFKQQAAYQKQCQQKITEELLPTAIKQIRQLQHPRTLNQDLVIANNAMLKKIRTDSWRSLEHGDRPKVGQTDIFDILANLNLTNLVESEVITDAHSHIHTDYASTCDRISLSDVCAMVLNNENVPALYATNAKEYNQYKQIYLTQYQTKVRKAIRQSVSQVNLEGSENAFNLKSIAKNNANMHNVNSWEDTH